MKSGKMKMQVQDTIELLRLVCIYHMIGTPRDKLALLVINENLKNLIKVDSKRCATCIFNLHRGPLEKLGVGIYSEIGLHSI